MKARHLLISISAASLASMHVSSARAQNVADEPQSAATLEAVYTGDLWQNVRGGLRRDGTYLDNLDLIANIDAEKVIGLKGTTLHVAALYNNRNTFSDTIVGDRQVLSNIDADGSLRLYEAWVEHDLGAVAVKAGLINLNDEFDVNETGALFLGSSHGIGPDFSQIGESGPSIFPISGLAALARFEIGPELTVRAGIFEGVPGDPARPRRTLLRLDGKEGQLVVGEAEFRPTADSRIVIGLRRLSGRHADPSDPADLPRQPQFGGYGLIEGQVATIGRGKLRAFARVGLADPKAHEIASHFGAGLTFSGPLFAGESHQEQLGLAIGVVRNAEAHRLTQAATGSSVDRHETAIELTYRIQATPWLALQPDVQYIINPGTNPSLGDALALGLRFELSWRGGL